MKGGKPKKIEYPPLAEEMSGGWTNLIRVFGPGAIIASVTVGTGETIFAPRTGAIFGYAMLWVVLVTVLFKATQVYTGARYLVLTGEHPVGAWMRIPGPRAWAVWLIGLLAVVSFPMWIAALADAVASLCIWITGVGGGTDKTGRMLWGTIIIAAAMLLSLVQTYNVIERVSTVILVFKVILIFIAVMVVKPDWAATLWGFVVPQIPDYQPWVAAGYPDIVRSPPWLEMAVLMGAVGGGVQDYVGYVGFLREKKWGAAGLGEGSPQNLPNDKRMIARGKKWLRAPALDTVVSFGSVLLITGCFMVLGAAVLHPRQLVPGNDDLYSRQSQFLAVIHPALVTLYKAGIFFAIFGVIYGAFELYTRTAYEPLRALWPNREWNMKKLRLWVVLYSGLGGLAILWSGAQTVTIAKYVSPFSGVLGCGLWCLAMIWVERTQLPRVYRMKDLLLLLTIVAGIAMTLVGGYVTLRSWTN